MNKASTLLDYGRRIERVTEYIAEHLDEPLSLDALAGIACFSPWHFHRIYRYLAHEPVADTVRRLRLHRAASELIRSTETIAGIAQRAGYGSAAAFDRAFRAAHGIAPGAYRKQGRLHPLGAISTPQENPMPDVMIRNFAPLSVAALRHTGPYHEIGSSFERLYTWAMARRLVGPPTRWFGIYYDDPKSVAVDQLRSDAAISIPPETPLDGEMQLTEIKGGRIAVLTHKGPYAELESVYRWLYGQWLPNSGEEADDRPCFEEYLNNPRALPPQDWLTDVCLPLTSR